MDEILGIIMMLIMALVLLYGIVWGVYAFVVFLPWPTF